ncbi:Polyketide cyclase/dehydrase and lipid transport superfamily protein [Euphorbia peplus]|nr:Polyketide cyclase/dehydrase and lipid transport superfamily protein [Euphorbia peplus]
MAGEKYDGLNIAEVKGVTADKVWSLLADFCNLHKCYPHVYYCVKEEGEDGKPGLVREIRSLGSPASKLFAADEIKNYLWSKDKLVKIDDKDMSLTYEMLDNNVGMKGYVCTYKVVEVDAANCKIEWSFQSDPIEGKTVEQFRTHRDNILRTFVQKIQSDFAVVSV